MYSFIIVLAVGGVAFMVGFATGLMYTNIRGTSSIKSKTRMAISIAVTLVWIFTTVADVFVTGYTASVLVHGIMGAIVGYFFTEEELSISLFSKE